MLTMFLRELAMSDEMKIDATYYANNASRQHRLAHKAMALHRFLTNECILDLGCGDGALTAEMAELATDGSVLGVDFSDEMIAYANATYQRSNLSFKQLSAERLDIKSKFTLDKRLVLMF